MCNCKNKTPSSTRQSKAASTIPAATTVAYRNNFADMVTVNLLPTIKLPRVIVLAANVAKGMGIANRQYTLSQRSFVAPKAFALFLMEHAIHSRLLDGEPVEIVEKVAVEKVSEVESVAVEVAADVVADINATASAIALADENDIDLSQVTGTGSNGRITKANVAAFIEGN